MPEEVRRAVLTHPSICKNPAPPIWADCGIRGGSTITQRLVKNLLGTGRSVLRKGAEVTLVPVAELVNVIEWGRGVYGAESACEYYYRTSARNIDRQQSAQFAAILPLPLKRRPDHMIHYSEDIPERMRQMGS